MAGRAGPRTVPTGVAALATGVTPATVRKWASRGKLKRYGRPGRAEYDIEELLQIAAKNAGSFSDTEAESLDDDTPHPGDLSDA